MRNNSLRDFFINNKDTVLSELTTVNESYRQLVKDRATISAKLFELTSKDTVLCEIIQKYSACTHDIQDIEYDTLYLQGFKDCFQLLKLIMAV